MAFTGRKCNHSVKELNTGSFEDEIKHEAFKRIKRKLLFDENCLLGADEASRSDWWVSAGAISRSALKTCRPCGTVCGYWSLE